MYPGIEPHEHGTLEVGDAQEVYWEVCGNPAGKPAVVLHGGPGSGCSPWWRRLFDPSAYRIVLFDQRGCGRSVPHASEPTVDLASNTTSHLVADIEALRGHLGIERWLVVGASWGSTLSLVYAQRHPERVSEMVLFSVVTTTPREIEWITEHIGRLFPAEWMRFMNGAHRQSPDEHLVQAYSRLLYDSDPLVRDQAASDWCAWEDTHVKVHQDDPPDARYEDPRFRLAFARLVTHYWRHAAWLGRQELQHGLPVLDGIPAVLIHGRQDVSSPLDIPWTLAGGWPSSQLRVIDDSGHHAEAAMTEAVVRATDRFARS